VRADRNRGRASRSVRAARSARAAADPDSVAACREAHLQPLVGHSDKEPVLLVPGTAATFHSQWSWNFAVELTNVGIPWCGVTPPGNQLGETQLAGECDVNAIRYLYHHSGDRQIAVVGHSQGGMQPRWPLRWWPDTRQMVADDVMISPDNQGATSEREECTTETAALHRCPLNFWQGATGSNFIHALNSRQEMVPGIDDTVIYSTTDELIQPKDTPLHGPGSYRWITLQ
jgi:triacylglycerol esterase/lipase EstA (alpha/beta hydrolase family)